MEQKMKFDAPVYNDQIIKIENKIQLMQENLDSFKYDAQQTIDRSSFFLYLIEKVRKGYALSWFLTFLIVLLFLLPGYLIYSISSQHEYYQLKKAEEKRLIMAAYGSFIEKYRIIFN